MKKDVFASGVRGQETVRDDLQFGGVECSDAENMCRPEHAPKTEIGYQISQFGVGHPLQFGEVDFDRLDLTAAMSLLEESQLAWLRLPKVVRDRYQSWQNVERAAASGELEQLLKTAGIAGFSSPASPDGSPSDSAAASA